MEFSNQIERIKKKLILAKTIDKDLRNKKIYIDVEGKFNTLLVNTPIKEDLDGKYADFNLLLSFYGKSIIPNK